MAKALPVLLLAFLGLCSEQPVAAQVECDASQRECGTDEAQFLQIRRGERRRSRVTECVAGATNENWDMTVDEACTVQSLPGCRADGQNDACRYCGAPKNGDPSAPTFPACPVACNESQVNSNWDTTLDEACNTQSLPGCRADGQNDACRFCGPPKNGDPNAPTYAPCPGAGTTATVASTTGSSTTSATTTVASTTQSSTSGSTTEALVCQLSVYLWCPGPGSGPWPTSAPCNPDEMDAYPAFTTCDLTQNSSTIRIRATGNHPGSCYGTQATVTWYSDDQCSNPTSSMYIYADGDTIRSGCKNRFGETVSGAWCRSSWSRV